MSGKSAYENDAERESDLFQEPQNGGAARLSVGRQLAAGRDACGFSVDDVARMLKLSASQVISIEADDWQRLPGKTIIRGFVRNYARLVGLDSDALMADMAGLAMPKPPELQMIAGTPVSLPKEGKTERKDIVRVIAGFVVLGVAILVYFFLPPNAWQLAVQAYHAATQLNETAAPETKPETARPLPQAASDSGAAENAGQSAPALDGDQKDAAVGAGAAVTEEGNADSAASTEDAVSLPATLKFRFAQPAWVEVRDRAGKVLLSQLCQGDSEREIAGEPPFSLVVGNATKVTLTYKGKVVDMSKRSKDDVARLTVE